MGFIARFFLVVLVLSLAELYLLVELASRFSLGLTLALCVLTGVLGGAMVRAQGLRTLAEIGALLGKGTVPGEQIVSGLILLSIGTMLLTPGFITDTIAFLMLVPPLRVLVARLLMGYFKRRIKLQTFGSNGAAGGFQMPRQGAHRPTPGGPAGERPPNEKIVIEVDAED